MKLLSFLQGVSWDAKRLSSLPKGTELVSGKSCKLEPRFLFTKPTVSPLHHCTFLTMPWVLATQNVVHRPAELASLENSLEIHNLGSHPRLNQMKLCILTRSLGIGVYTTVGKAWEARLREIKTTSIQCRKRKRQLNTDQFLFCFCSFLKGHLSLNRYGWNSTW